MFKNKKFGFTLAEMMIVVGIIGVVATLSMSILNKAKPDKEMVMFKKAYYLMGRSIVEMINDDDMYPENMDGNQYFGNVDEVEVKGKLYEGDTKFCELFASRVNTMGTPSCTEKTFTDGTASTGQFTTADGITWILPISNFDDNSTTYPIYIDVDGEKGQNCFYNETTCKNPDRFTVEFYQDGKMEVNGEIEKKYLATSNLSEDQ